MTAIFSLSIFSLSSNAIMEGLYVLKAGQAPRNLLRRVHRFSQMTRPSRYRTGLNTDWKGPDSAPPSLNLSESAGLGGAWVPPEGAEHLGCTNPSMDTPHRHRSIGEHLNKDESFFEDAVFQG